MAKEEMNFLVYALETYRMIKDIPGKKMYETLKQSGAVDFIVEFYDTLHSTNDSEIVWQIDDYLECRGITLA